MTTIQFLFYLFAALAVASALGMLLNLRNTVASAMSLVVTMVALLFSRGWGPPAASADNRSASKSVWPVEPGADPPPFVDRGCSPSAVAYALILVLSLVVIGTIWLAMLPLFGTSGLDRLIDVHRYSGLGLLAATVVHGLLVVARAPRQRSRRCP